MKKTLILGLLATTLMSTLVFASEGPANESINATSSQKSVVKTSIVVNEMDNTDAIEGTVLKDGETRGAVNWSDTVIPYNTRMKFTRSNGDPYIIRKGVTAYFKFGFSGSDHVEVGFMDKDGDVLYTLLDEVITNGRIVSIEPKSDVEGYFYVWNKSADDIEITDITMIY